MQILALSSSTRSLQSKLFGRNQRLCAMGQTDIAITRLNPPASFRRTNCSGGESRWGVGVPVPVGAGSPGRPLLVRPGLSPLLLSPARSSSAGQSLLLGSWGRVMCSVSRYRSPVRWFGSLTRSWSDSAPHCRSRIRLFGCSARC